MSDAQMLGTLYGKKMSDRDVEVFKEAVELLRKDHLLILAQLLMLGSVTKRGTEDTKVKNFFTRNSDVFVETKTTFHSKNFDVVSIYEKVMPEGLDATVESIIRLAFGITSVPAGYIKENGGIETLLRDSIRASSKEHVALKKDSYKKNVQLAFLAWTAFNENVLYDKMQFRDLLVDDAAIIYKRNHRTIPSSDAVGATLRVLEADNTEKQIYEEVSELLKHN